MRTRIPTVVFVVFLAAIMAAGVAAQSGRRQPPQKPAPVPKVDSVPALKTDGSPLPTKIESLLVTADIVHDSHTLKSNYASAFIKEFTYQMKSHPRPFYSVEKGGKMTFEAAKERAAKEPFRHIIWLGVVMKTDAWPAQDFVSHIDYAILVPGSGKTLLSGQLIPGRQAVVGQGGIMTIPKMPSRTSAVVQMTQGARQVADRLKSTGWF